MESVHQVKEALSAKSRTATLDELRSEGRSKVRLIRAEQVAAMIAEAVHSAIEQSELLAPGDVERLIDRSRKEFQAILQEREAEVRKAQAVEERLSEQEQVLAERERELAELRTRFAALQEQLAGTQAELDQARTAGQERPAETRAPAVPLAAAPAAPAAAPSVPPEALTALLQEMASLKASLQHREAAPAPAAATGGADFAGAIEKLAGSLNDRLEKLGRKLGVAGGSEAAESVNFDGLFKDDGKTLESNMDNIQIKQKAGGGIAANLARLKKLKGGG